ARIAAWQQTQVDAGAFSGAIAAIARNGKVAYLQATGFRDRAKTMPLQSDSIFWIASMTKPISSVAAMMLVEEGKLDLAAPVSQYIPEFKDTMVAVETRSEERRVGKECRSLCDWSSDVCSSDLSVAAMMLVEEGKLDLAAPVSQYIPEFKDTMVAVET